MRERRRKHAAREGILRCQISFEEGGGKSGSHSLRRSLEETTLLALQCRACVPSYLYTHSLLTWEILPGFFLWRHVSFLESPPFVCSSGEFRVFIIASGITKQAG